MESILDHKRMKSEINRLLKIVGRSNFTMSKGIDSEHNLIEKFLQFPNTSIQYVIETDNVGKFLFLQKNKYDTEPGLVRGFIFDPSGKKGIFGPYHPAE